MICVYTWSPQRFMYTLWVIKQIKDKQIELTAVCAFLSPFDGEVSWDQSDLPLRGVLTNVTERETLLVFG